MRRQRVRVVRRAVCGLIASILTVGLPGCGLLAQSVRVLVVDRASDTPLVGAIASLVLADGSRPAAALTDEQGRATLHATLGARVRIRAERIGYAADSSALLVVEADPLAVRLALVARPLTLEKVDVRARRSCRLDSATGPAAARLWAEVRKALDATVLSAPQGLPIQVLRYTRTLDQALRVVAETTSSHGIPGGMPFATASPEELSRLGFAHDVDGTLTFFAPDAGLLLSDRFTQDHCFAVKELAGTDALIGLAFEPAPGRTVSDVSGVLWVEQPSAELRWLDYTYTHLPMRNEAGRAGGRLEFVALPNGQWIVGQWYIRLPRLGRVGAARVGALTVPARDSLLGYREEGGWAALAAGREAPADLPALTGVAFDSLRGVPMSSAHLSLARGVAEAVTDSVGRYRLRSVLAGRYILATDDPRLVRFGTHGAQQEVVLSRGSESVANWTVSSAATLRARYCGAEAGRGERPQLIIGYVVDSLTHAPVPGARTLLSWRRLAVQAATEMVSASVSDSTIETESDEAGIVTFCRPPRVDLVRLHAELGGAIGDRTVAADDTTSAVEVELALSAAAAKATTLRGRVVVRQDSTMRPAVAAEVLLPGMSRAARPAPDGAFAFAMLPWGTYTVVVRAVGYRPVLARVTLPQPADAVREFVLTPNVTELPGVVVTGTAVAAKMRGFEERRAMNAGGHFITRAQLAAREHSRLSDILRSVPGVKLVRRPDNTVFLESTRSAFASTLDRQSTEALPDGSYGLNRCYFQIYLDGAVIFQPGGLVKPPNIDDFAPNGVEAIELYPGPANTPIQFGGTGAACGTIVLWTRAP